MQPRGRCEDGKQTGGETPIRNAVPWEVESRSQKPNLRRPVRVHTRSHDPLRLGSGGSRGRLIGLALRLFIRLGRLVLGRIGGARRGSLGIARLVGGPKGEVVTQQLHDKGTVAVRLLRKRVKLGDGIVEGLLGQVARAVGGVEDLVVEDGEVERETQADGMRRGELSLSNIRGALYSGLGWLALVIRASFPSRGAPTGKPLMDGSSRCTL